MISNEENNCALCKKCSELNVQIRDDTSLINNCDNTSIRRCQEWLENCSISENQSISSSESNNSSEDFDTNQDEIDSLLNKNHLLDLQTLLNKTSNNYDKVYVTKSKRVHVGNITYINGPIYINETNSFENKQININCNEDGKESQLEIIPRIHWVAQPRLGQKEYLEEPAKYVIISHTATEEAHTRSENILLVRVIQQFHIESRNWDDIGYNFLIGCDGNIYEGRGWNVVGAHTLKYNKKSVGISFIGCFNDKLPTGKAMRQVQPLIDYGIKIGAIKEDYNLLAHCQCSNFKSPGKVLYEELKSWKNWDGSIQVTY